MICLVYSVLHLSLLYNRIDHVFIVFYGLSVSLYRRSRWDLRFKTVQ